MAEPERILRSSAMQQNAYTDSYPIIDLPLRSRHALLRAGYKTVGDLRAADYKLHTIYNIGKASVREIREITGRKAQCSTHMTDEIESRLRMLYSEIGYVLKLLEQNRVKSDGDSSS